MLLAGLLVQLTPVLEDLHILATMALRRCHVADAAVAMLQVVPMHELRSPRSRVAQIGKAAPGVLRAVFGRSEQRKRPAKSSTQLSAAP